MHDRVFVVLGETVVTLYVQAINTFKDNTVDYELGAIKGNGKVDVYVQQGAVYASRTKAEQYRDRRLSVMRFHSIPV